MFDAFLAMITAGLVSFVFWQQFDPRIVVFFVIAIGFAELFIVFRWRMTIACPKCGFDPVLYKKKPELAAARVKEYYKERAEDPLSAFSPPPRLPVLINRKADRMGDRTALR